MIKLLVLAFLLFSVQTMWAQAERWQQHVKYEMDIDVDAEHHQFKGKQKLTYTNNSNDALHKIYYHPYFNAFQPNSMMDERSRTISDPDPRVGSRIANLTPEEFAIIKSYL